MTQGPSRTERATAQIILDQQKQISDLTVALEYSEAQLKRAVAKIEELEGKK